MDQIEAVRLALAELGDANAEELAAFVQDRYGVKIQPKYMPIIKASLREKERLAAFRQKRAAEAATTPASPVTPPE